MTSNLKIIRVRDLIRVSPQGKLKLEDGKIAVQDVGSVSGIFANFDLLIDTRGAESQLSVLDIWQLAKELAAVVHAGTKGFWAKIPVLCPTNEFDHAKFFELCSLNRGLNVRAFTSFEELFEWLSEPSQYKKE